MTADRLTDGQVAAILLCPKNFEDEGWDEYTGSNLQGLAREVAAYRAAMKEVDSDDAPCEYRGTEHFAWASGWNAAIEHLRQAADGG